MPKAKTDLADNGALFFSKRSSLLSGQAASAVSTTTKQPPHPSHCWRSSLANNHLKEQLQHVSIRVGALEKGELGSFRMEKSHVVQEGKEKGAHLTQSKVHLHEKHSMVQKIDPSLISPMLGKGWLYVPSLQLPCLQITYPNVFLALTPTETSLGSCASCLHALPNHLPQ